MALVGFLVFFDRLTPKWLAAPRWSPQTPLGRNFAVTVLRRTTLSNANVGPRGRGTDRASGQRPWHLQERAASVRRCRGDDLVGYRGRT
jgi:hypothetical protein